MTTADLLTSIAESALLVPFIQAFMAAIKTALPGWPNKYWPVMSIAVGIVLSLGVALVTSGWWPVAVIVGSVAGMAAAKLYQYGQSTQVEPKS